MQPDEKINSDEPKKPTHYCSFCGKSNLENDFMITNDGVEYIPVAVICGACIDLCRDIIGAERMLKKGDENAK